MKSVKAFIVMLLCLSFVLIYPITTTVNHLDNQVLDSGSVIMPYSNPKPVDW